MNKFCWHGTSKENAFSILETGFRAETWFAYHLEDALKFGGPYVFLVQFDDDRFNNIEDDAWQFFTLEHIPISKIISAQKHLIKEIKMSSIDKIRRESATESRLRSMDTHEIVGELHRLADRAGSLETALESIAANTCCDGCHEAASVAQSALDDHDSDCAVHNAPAVPVGPCDCKPKKQMHLSGDTKYCPGCSVSTSQMHDVYCPEVRRNR